MSSPSASDRKDAELDPRIGLRYAIADQLIPLFQMTARIETDEARLMAHSAIDAYYPECRADCVNAARIIASSMAAVALIGKAMIRDTPMPEQLRILGRANAMNRAADQSERAMMLRRRYHQDNPPAEPAAMWPEHPAPQDAPAETDPEVAKAVQEYQAARDAAAPKQPAPAPAQPAATASVQHAGTPQPRAALMPEANIAAIRSAFQKFSAGGRPATSRRQTPLSNSAIQQTLTQTPSRQPDNPMRVITQGPGD